MRPSGLVGPLLPALLLLVPAAALLGTDLREQRTHRPLKNTVQLQSSQRSQSSHRGRRHSVHSTNSIPERVVQGKGLSCERNGTQYRVVQQKNYSSVPCDVPCWSTTCVEVGGQCKDPSGFMCSEVEFKSVAYGNASDPVFVELQKNSIIFPLQKLVMFTSMEAMWADSSSSLLEESALTSFKSAVPLPYLEFTGPLQTPGIDFDAAIKGASMMISNGCSQSLNAEELSRRPLDLHTKGDASIGRLVLAERLMRHLRVDSFGGCLHNQEFPAAEEGRTLPYFEKKMLKLSSLKRSPSKNIGKLQKISVARKYLFHFAFENTVLEDYVTEKMWDMLRAGTLPVYLGAPNIHELLPMKAFVNAADFETADDLGDYLTYLAGNETAYMEYHKWRSEPLPRAFKEKWGFARVHSVCRACRWGYAKREMLTWDSVKQRVSPRADS